MSLNSAATLDGREIGRAQALQAEAAGIPATVHMNPILIKPTGDACSQILQAAVTKRLTVSAHC
jgi:adenosylcobyric acid synthase